MSDTPPHYEERRFSEWERKEELVLKSLQDLRLSSDSALKATGELNTSMVRMEATNSAQFAKQTADIAELKSRLDKANQWLMGLLATIIIFILGQVVNYLSNLAPALPK